MSTPDVPGRVASLLYTDEAGRPALPDAVMEEARDSGRWKDLVDPVAALMDDRQVDALYRWVACQCLCGWADPAGYEAVRLTAGDPARSVFSRVAEDRFTRDQSWGELAEAVGESREFAEERGTLPLRLDALRALLRAADRVDLVHGKGRGIVDALWDADVQELRPEVEAAVQATEAALARGDRLDPVRLVGLLVVLARVDEPAAVSAARELLSAEPSRDVLVWSTDLVAGGRGEESLLLGGEIGRLAAERQVDVSGHLDRALESRRRRAAAPA